jgi:uncharacterized protein YlzI (FlbEa/FlbD family)
MELNEINKQLKVLNAEKLKIEKLMKKPNGDILNQAWLIVQNEIDELLELIDNCDFSVEEV